MITLHRINFQKIHWINFHQVLRIILHQMHRLNAHKMHRINFHQVFRIILHQMHRTNVHAMHQYCESLALTLYRHNFRSSLVQRLASTKVQWIDFTSLNAT